ncbi:hypothetical protein ACJMK2_006213 [Sinanodonta woodiana]|uniref:Ubiquitin-like domain-containing protein n=1 Tax=Sinanodonta woodiana TaxID=1069815 RepID=A0ABD3VSF3_SINWO
MTDIALEIVVNVPADEAERKISINVSENNTVAGVIRKVCKENGIPVKSSYILCDADRQQLQWSKTLRNCGISTGSVLYLYSEEGEGTQYKKPCKSNTWWFLAALSFFIGGAGITAISVLLSKNGEIIYQYGIVMDAGSTHTRLYVYKWNGDKIQQTAVAHQVHTCLVPGGKGISEYSSDIANLSVQFETCLNEAKKVVPSNRHKSTPVFLGATAGMRMLNESNHTLSEIILEKVREIIKTYPFQFDSPKESARIISGDEEGTFGWVTSNYILGKFGVQPPASFQIYPGNGTLHNDVGEGTIGALDMGGASTQITFYTPNFDNNTEPYRFHLNLYKQNYSVYTHSYLCYGINQAELKYQANLILDQGLNSTTIYSPCMPQGFNKSYKYSEIFEAPCIVNSSQHPANRSINSNHSYVFIGTGENKTCITAVQQLFNFSAACNHTDCSFNGVYQPKVYGDFYAFSSFFYEMDFLNLTKKPHSLDEFNKILSKFCKMSWIQVQVIPTKFNESLPWYCFEGQYILILLTQGYKFDRDSRTKLKFVGTVNGVDIGWSLGFMLYSSNLITNEGPTEYISIAIFAFLTVLFIVFVLIAIGFGFYAIKYMTRREGMYRRLSNYGAL